MQAQIYTPEKNIILRLKIDMACKLGHKFHVTKC